MIIAYTLTAVAAGVYAYQKRSWGWRVAISVVLSVVGGITVLRYSFFPFPQGTYGVVARTFLTVLLAFVGLFAYVRSARPEAVERLGAEAQLDGVPERA